MKFSKETIATLKNFASINSGIKLTKGNFIMTQTLGRSIHAEATIQDEIDFDAAIFDLNGFLGVLSLVSDDAEVSLVNNNILIADDRSSIYWPTTSDKTITFPSRPIAFPDAVQIKFELKVEDYQLLTRVSRSLSIDTLAIAKQDGKLVINGYNKASDMELTNVLYQLEVGEYDEDHEFNFVIDMRNMKMQMDSYEVLILATKQGNAVKFKGENASYVISIESTSKHTF